MALANCEDQTAADLRAYARRAPSLRTGARAHALANALEGMTRAEAARVAGMERQTLSDAVLRYNAEGLAGLENRFKPGRPPRLSEGEQAALAAIILRGPDPERTSSVASRARTWRASSPNGLAGTITRLP